MAALFLGGLICRELKKAPSGSTILRLLPGLIWLTNH